MQMLGLFYTKNPHELRNIIDAPYHILGRHVLCADSWATDGGAIACVLGQMRNADEIHRAVEDAGLTVQNKDNLSELALNAYRLWGTEFPEKLMGALSAVVIDQDANRMILSRDRMGEKPVFYAYRYSSIAFSDHPAPLLKSSVATRTVDREGLCEIFGLGPARTPGRTPFRDICQLEPGCTLIADGRGHKVRRYFSLKTAPHEDSLQSTVDTVRALIEDATKRTKCYSPGSMLSGGLDSTVLTALASKQGSEKVRTYSVDYEGNSEHFSESAFQPERDAPYIDLAIKAIGTEHTAFKLSTHELFAAIEDATAARAFPGMADIDSSLLLFARRIAQSERFILSGECGDEVFGGYPWFRNEALINSELFPWSGSLVLREKLLDKSVREKLSLSNYVKGRYYESIALLPTLPADSPLDAKLRQIQGLCFEWFMPNLQERAQRMCAASGLTVFTPYCDDRLVQYVYNVPWEMKALGGVEKGLLREAAKGLLPDELLNRKKSPYPKTHHPKYTELVKKAALEMLHDKRSPLIPLLDFAFVKSLIQGSLAPTETPWFGQLMTGPQMLAYLVQVDMWMRMFEVEIDI